MPTEAPLVRREAKDRLFSFFFRLRDTSELPAALWITVGSLDTDGIVLQLKARRVGRATTRAGTAGAWCAYAIHSGALTVRNDLVDRVPAAEAA